MTSHQVQQLQLAVQQDRVMAGGSALELSARAHQALILFLESDGQVLSKEWLMQQLWSGVIVSDDSLFKVIQEVRKALRDLGVQGQVLINVYGKGYQWRVPAAASQSVQFNTVYWLAAVVVLLLLAGWLVNRFSQQPSALTDEAFTQQVEAIRAGLDADLPGLQQLADTHPTDRLKGAYLLGLVQHQSGNYDAAISLLSQGLVGYQDLPAHPVQADAHYLLARMYIYRDDRQTLKYHLDEAERFYGVLNDEDGLLDVAIERARYHQVLLEFDYSVELLHQVRQSAIARGDEYHQLKALSNLAYAHQQLHQPVQREAVLRQALELALKLADGKYAAYSYGALAEIHAARREPVKAMKQAQLALRYVLNQHDTNVFQQGFSAFYLLLRPLGHTDLAERYLQQAINVQQQFNDQGVLVDAELNLAKVRIDQQAHQRSHELLKALREESLTDSELQEVLALQAYNSYQLHDNIGAYTQAKPLLASSGNNRQALLYARAAFVLAAWQLERNAEASKELQALADWLDPLDPEELGLFLQVAEQTSGDVRLPDWGAAGIQVLTEQLAGQRRLMIQQTRPDADLMSELDQYLTQISQQ
jgi:DNA-binding winged helix-turn-helix (wHTH) protein